MWLTELLHDIAVCEHRVWVTNISVDSRSIVSGGVFFALSGAEKHGLEFAAQAQQQGAFAIVYEPSGTQTLLSTIEGIALIAVPALASQLGLIAARFYRVPSEKLALIGITGTNGKTSCSHFLAQSLNQAAVIGTLGWGRCSDLKATKNTTPDAFALQAMLAECVQDGIKAVALEVSSHGLAQGRLNALQFKGAVFTNLSREHLDYHGDMETYFKAKLSLFTRPDLQYAVVNIDDIYGQKILGLLDEAVTGFSFSLNAENQGANLEACDIHYRLTGSAYQLRWQGQLFEVYLPLLAEFNVQNSLAVLGVLIAEGYTIQQAINCLARLRPIAGRMECFTYPEKQALVVVDYAHTPDALKQALLTLKQHCAGRLILVFGCGGDRDKGKRPLMGRIAQQLADYMIITDDNPRFECSDVIINHIIQDLEMNQQDYEILANRTIAIERAIECSEQGDIVLIAGKGHESYQDIKGIKKPLSDRHIVRDYLA